MGVSLKATLGFFFDRHFDKQVCRNSIMITSRLLHALLAVFRYFRQKIPQLWKISGRSTVGTSWPCLVAVVGLKSKSEDQSTY